MENTPIPRPQKTFVFHQYPDPHEIRADIKKSGGSISPHALKALSQYSPVDGPLPMEMSFLVYSVEELCGPGDFTLGQIFHAAQKHDLGLYTNPGLMIMLWMLGYPHMPKGTILRAAMLPAPAESDINGSHIHKNLNHGIFEIYYNAEGTKLGWATHPFSTRKKKPAQKHYSPQTKPILYSGNDVFLFQKKP